MQPGREINLVIDGSPVDLENIATASARKVAVYTAIFSTYDDPPTIQDPDGDIDYFLFTDGSVTTAPAPWQIRIVDPVFADPQRDARRVKVLPHLFLPKQYETSVWIDSSLFLKSLTTKSIEQLLGGSHMAVTRHNARTCIYEEAKAVLDVKYETPARVERQMSRYRLKGFPERFGLHATMFLVRKHLQPECLTFDLEWWEELSRFSKRDQLSFDFTRWRHPRVRVNTLQMEVRYNPIFGFKLAGKDHKSSERRIDEHLYTALRKTDDSAANTPAYNDLYDLFSFDFLAHLRNLRKIELACSGSLHTDPWFAGVNSAALHSPPDPRKGLEREILLRSVAARQRFLDMQFDNGGRAALLLSQTSIAVTSLDTKQSRHAEPCAGYLKAYFEDRLTYARLSPDVVEDVLQTLSFEDYDAIHVDGTADLEEVLKSIAYAATRARAGTTLIVSGMGSEPVSNAVQLLRSRDILAQHGDLACADLQAFVVMTPAPAETTTVLSAILPT